jgi:hypothetical protein
MSRRPLECPTCSGQVVRDRPGSGARSLGLSPPPRQFGCWPGGWLLPLGVEQVLSTGVIFADDGPGLPQTITVASTKAFSTAPNLHAVITEMPHICRVRSAGCGRRVP